MFKNNKALFAIFLIVFIDLLGFSLILPLLPYLARTFQASDFQIGLLVASYAAAQLIGAPILGRLSDKYGRRPVLLISIAGNAVGFIILGLANTLWVLFLARILAGFTAANISVAQAYISDVTDEKNRARGLGLIGAAFGLGFIIGPAIGGALSQVSYSLPAFISAALSIFNFVLVVTWLPESLTAEHRRAIANTDRLPFTIPALIQVLRRPLIGPLLNTRFFFGMSFSLFQTIFSLYALERFNLNAQQVGYILAYVGILSVFTQGFLIGRLTNRFSENALILVATIIMAAALLGWALAPSVPVLLIIMAPIAVSGGILNTVINSAITKSVSPVEIGGMLGISTSLEAMTRVISPSLGGLILELVGKRFGTQVGTSAPGILASLMLFGLVSYVYRFIYHAQPSPAAVLPTQGESF
jgi:DHA1 family tetracycline resistance protein-like MFS transporter